MRCDAPKRLRYHQFMTKREIDMATQLDSLIHEHDTVEEKEAYEKWARERVRRARADARPTRTDEEVFERSFAMLSAKTARGQRD